MSPLFSKTTPEQFWGHCCSRGGQPAPLHPLPGTSQKQGRRAWCRETAPQLAGSALLPNEEGKPVDGAGAGWGGSAGGLLLLKKKNVVEKLEHCASSLPCTLAELGTLCLAAMKRPVAGSVQQAPSNSSQSAGALLFSPG